MTGIAQLPLDFSPGNGENLSGSKKEQNQVERERGDRDRNRSPNYPQFPLSRAVEDVKALYKREGRTAVPLEVAVRVWGYDTTSGSVSGTARSRLAALRHFELVETDAKNRIRLSERGLTIALRSETSLEYDKAVQEAALAPTIFRELREEMGQASDDAIEYHLVSARNFSADGARRLRQSYRATMEFAGLDRSSDSGPEFASQRDDDIRKDATVLAGLATVEAGVLPATIKVSGTDSMKLAEAAAVTRRFVFPLDDGAVAEVAFSGRPVTEEDVEMLQSYLDMWRKRLAKSASPAVSPASLPPPASQPDATPQD